MNAGSIRTVDVLSAPFSGGQCHSGVALGPQSLLRAGLLRAITDLKCKVNSERIHLDFDANSINSTACAVSNVTKEISERVYESTKKGRFPLLIGGDHSVSLGSISGLLRAREDTRVLWVDAHADINTPSISKSGNYHGMPVPP